jgi:hypothetical protein
VPYCTLGELTDAYESLSELTNQAMDIASTTKVLRLLKACRPHASRVLEARSKEASRLGQPIGNGNIRIPPDKLEEYKDCLKPLLSEIIPVPESARLNLAELAGVKLSPASLERLAPFLRDI